MADCDGRSCRIITPPSGWDEIIKFYGDIRKHVKADGTLSSAWEREHLAFISVPWKMVLAWNTSIRVRRIRCHIRLAELLQHILYGLHESGAGETLSHFGGCFNYRPQRGSHKLSLHSWGAAIDWNPATNRMGTEGNMDPRVVNAFERHGWTWGGRWRRRDDQHMQYAKGY